METKEIDIDNSSRHRKFGLPNWMVNNIERLNFVTDFEQYACSPPETESFLSEHMDSCDSRSDYSDGSDSPPIVMSELHDDKPNFTTDNKGVTESKSAPCLLTTATEQVATLSIIENIKNEEFYSSPDTTPCVTPQPSPAPRRRMSGQQDSVQTNPGRWFYLGNIKQSDTNVNGKNLNKNKENRAKHSEKANEIPRKLKDSPVKQKKDGIRLVISNFDINAISPSSW